jgi:hypothetical protein
MKFLAAPLLLAAAISVAPVAYASPSAGDVCYNWKATSSDTSGQTLYCTHLPDSGHLMYWETSMREPQLPPSWVNGSAYRPNGWKEDPQRGDPGWYGNNGPCNSNDVTTKPSRDGHVLIEIWGPQGCNPSLPMTGTN